VTQPPALPPHASWSDLVARALAEDIGTGDLTSNLVLSADATGRACIEARHELVVCGLEVAREVFHQIDPELDFEPLCRDGQRASADQPLAQLEGRVRAILAGERSALNFLGRTCGVASWTRRFVEAVAGTRAVIVDTRKTLPGWRVLDKYATATGGAQNHRAGLYDGILLKDNHIAAAGGVAAAVKAAIAGAPVGVRVQVEVESEQQAEDACSAGADFLLLDNRTPDQCAHLVERFGERALLEASGGIDLGNVRTYAESGVHRISLGALTHSAPSADVALEIEPGGVAA